MRIRSPAPIITVAVRLKLKHVEVARRMPTKPARAAFEYIAIGTIRAPVSRTCAFSYQSGISTISKSCFMLLST